MLYDPKWEAETKPGVFSLQSLIAWLEKMPANETYCYLDHGRCLLGQYFSAMGFENAQVFSDGLCHGPRRENQTPYPREFDSIALHWAQTFGAALKRAREAANCAAQ
jgi:hypothetical protein